MTVKLIKQQEQHLLTDWDTARTYLKMPTETTRNVYIGPNGMRWDLSGRNKGRQGARLATHIQGDYHLPIDQLFTEGAYQMGATYERTNYPKRLINIGVVLGYTLPDQGNCSESQYRAIESNWWDSWPAETPGWWLRQTPFSGLRWAQVQLAKTVDTAMPSTRPRSGTTVSSGTCRSSPPIRGGRNGCSPISGPRTPTASPKTAMTSKPSTSPTAARCRRGPSSSTPGPVGRGCRTA
jgi:hypothetical protein